jgi:hypothetical protein
MATDSESFNRDLYDLLKVRGYKPVPLDSKNQRVLASQSADVIEFTFNKDGKDYGKAWVSIDNAANVIVYYDEEQQESPSTTTPGVEYDDSWTGFLKHLKNWAQRRQLSFELSNKDRLGDDMRQRDYYKMKERVSEGYHPMGKKASYNDAVPEVKIILQHNRALEEGEQRYRNVAKIFLENQDGERFLAPTTRPGIARVYARHIAEGGVPNDDKWNHIKTVVEDYNKMAGFARATRNGQFNESAQELVNEGINHYNNLRETLQKLATHRGYQAYFESYTPALMEDELDESINELFVQEMVDPRIESAMPILSRLKKPVTEMEEVDTLAEWADGIINEKLELDEGDVTPFKKKQDDDDLDDDSWIPSEEDFEQEEKHKNRKPKAANDVNETPKSPAELIKNKIEKAEANAKARDPHTKIEREEARVARMLAARQAMKEAEDLSEMEKDLHQGQRHDPRKGPAGPDKTAKMMKAKDAVKAARKSLDKAFKGDVEENFIGMAPQAVAEEEVEEGLGDTIKKGVKSFKRGMKGWEKGMHDVDTVKAATKSLSPDQKEKALAAKAGKGSPAELQQKLIKREKPKPVEEDLDANQKRVGQLGPIGGPAKVGDLVGANESTEFTDELSRIIDISRFNR